MDDKKNNNTADKQKMKLQTSGDAASKDNQNNQLTEKQESTAETQTKYREISEEELKKILEEHKKWIGSEGKEGKQANFENTNLEGKSGHRANFEKFDLQGVSFRNSNINHGMLNETILDSAAFYKASLKQADFRKAKLNNSDFRKADLTIAHFQKAQLKEANFEKATLINAHLEETECQDANFRKAKFANAHFRDAKINRANLQKADLSYVDGLNEAELQYADLRGATGLLGNEFAQADLTGTKLPKNIEEFKALEIVEKTSQNARKIFFAMLLGCVYSWLTIATTTDVRLLTNSASSPLPIIGTEIPIAWFYIAAPLVLICLYVYFHLYLDNLWKGLAGLPAIFPDGKPLDQTAYPWLLNSLVCRHFEKLKKRPIFAYMKEWITIFLAWAVVPFTMIAFWFRYIPRHDWFGTCLHISLIILSVGFALIFYRLCALILQGKEKDIFKIQKFWTNRKFYYDGVSLVIVGILFLLLSYGAIDGEKLTMVEGKTIFSGFSIKNVVPWAFEKIGYDVFADFREKAVSEKPDNYWEIAEKNQLRSVKGPNLKGRNLNNADMYGAFLVKADLRGASLSGANIGRTNLNLSNLRGAELQLSYLEEADLQNANLEYTNLKQAFLEKVDFYQANLKGANLMRANLKNANLDEANLEGANLMQANLEGANFDLTTFEGANLQEADFRKAKSIWIGRFCKAETLYNAKLDSKYLNLVKDNCPQLLEEPKEEPDKTN